MLKNSQLTDIELKKLAIGQIDLAAGYPNLKLPNWIEQIYREETGRQIFEEFLWPVEKLRDIDDDLTHVVSALLSIDDPLTQNMCTLPNGSIAINRVVASMAMTGGQIVVSSPSFDVIAATISEFHNCSLKVVNSLNSNEFDVERIIDAIGTECVGVVLCSPDNPTGAILSEEDIYKITEQAAKFNVTVFIDQCFCLCGEGSIMPPLVANCAHPDSSWIMLWDTGKTIGLAQEKLAFLFLSNSIFTVILDRVRVLCFDTPLRTKKLFLNILEDTRIENYLAYFREVIAKNRETLEVRTLEKVTKCYLPKTTSMALVYLDSHSAEYLRDKVHMVPLSIFSLTSEASSYRYENWYRLALAREHCDFLRAVDHIEKAITRNVSYP